MRDSVDSCVLPNLRPVPVGEQAYFPQIPAGWQAVELELLQMLSRRRLFASQPREPDVKRFKRAHERFDFAQLAAPGRLATIQNPKYSFLLDDRWRRQH